MVLLLLAANALFMVYQRRDEALGGASLSDALDEQMSFLAPLLLVAVAVGLSVRFGAVNLALPSLAALVASAPGLFVGSNPLIGLGFTAAAAAAVTLGFALLALVFRTPPWLAGLAISVAVIALVPLIDGEVFGYELPEPEVWESPGGGWLLLGAGVVAVVGGLIGLSPGVRDRMVAVREAADGTGARDARTVFAFIGTAFVASLLAAGAGFLWTVFMESERGSEALFTFAALPFGFFVSVELFALIAVFLGGTSPRGRRGGVFGTLLAAVLLWAVFLLWGSFEGDTGDVSRYERWSGLLSFGLLVFGLAMAAVLNRLGRPKAEDRGEAPADTTQDPNPFNPSPPSLFDPNTESSATPR
ncbi:hypothetical protein GCM10028833_13640 [Glycomyces tarimensis]